MQELKQSTQVDVRVGPFVDVGDGFTPETGITLGTADEAELLKHNGAATVDISAATWAAVTNCDGWYDLTLTTSHTDTLGQLTVVVQDDSVCLPVHVNFMVVTANWWDSKYGTDELHTDIVQISGDTTAADNCESFFDGTGYAGTGNTIPTVTTTTNVTNQVTADVTAISGDTTAANNLEADYDGTGYNKSASTIGTCTTNTDMVSEPPTANAIADQVWDEATSGHVAGGSFGAQCGTDIDAILVDTNSLNDTKVPDTISLANINAQCDTALTDYDAVVPADLPSNFADLAITVTTGQVTVGTNNDKTGYSISGTKQTLDALNDISTSDVNTQVSDVMKTDTISEMAQQAPPATPTFEEAVMYLYMAIRNKIDVTATLKEFHNDAGTVIWKKTLSDNGTTYSEAEGATGP